ACVQQAISSTEGFTFVLSGLKAFLEHNVLLNLVADRFPKGTRNTLLRRMFAVEARWASKGNVYSNSGESSTVGSTHSCLFTLRPFPLPKGTRRWLATRRYT